MIKILSKRPNKLVWTKTYNNGSVHKYEWIRGRRYGSGDYHPAPVVRDTGRVRHCIPGVRFKRMSDCLAWAEKN